MWWVLGILAAIALIVTAILRLRIYIIIKSDADGKLMLRFKVLFFTFGAPSKKPKKEKKKDKKDNALVKAIKKVLGIDSFDTAKMKQDVEQQGFHSTVLQTLDIVLDLLREALTLYRHLTATKFELDIMCSDNDAADAAIKYGRYCALIYPALGVIANTIGNVKEKGRRINIQCGFNGEAQSLRYNFTVYFRAHHALSALVRIIFAEVKRKAERTAAKK